MRVKFIRDRNWTPPEARQITVAYKAGMELTIKRSWAEQMILDGDAQEVEPPRSQEAAQVEPREPQNTPRRKTHARR